MDWTDHTGHVSGLINIRSVDNPNEYRLNHDKYVKEWEKLKEMGEVVGNVFVITVCPLSQNIIFPVHIHLSQTGNADDEVESAVQQVLDIMKECGVDARLVGSDADVKYRAKFEEQFLEWSKFVSCNNGNVNQIQAPSVLWTNDCAHILKRSRSRMVTHGRLFAFKGAEEAKTPAPNTYIDVELLKSVNKLMSDTWFRNNGRDSMDDYYPHYIFSGETLSGILSTIPLGTDSAIIHSTKAYMLNYVLPMVCMAKVLRHKKADRKLRLQWAHLAVFIMLLNYSWLKVQWTNRTQERELHFIFHHSLLH